MRLAITGSPLKMEIMKTLHAIDHIKRIMIVIAAKSWAKARHNLASTQIDV